ncbi:MAG TPA: hypothetical protein VFB54_17340 [Burkholderiales bacterium]|nr:hypothetical protein [Burkholderiales bacterium]
MNKPSHELLVDGSETNAAALESLAELLRDLGYRVVKKLPRESTLRVYRSKHGQYPLLNPRFVPHAKELKRGWNKPGLQVSVYSKKPDPTLDKVLGTFRSDSCEFKASDLLGTYRLHGWFFMPLNFSTTGDFDLAALGKPFAEIRQLLHAY